MPRSSADGVPSVLRSAEAWLRGDLSSRQARALIVAAGVVTTVVVLLAISRYGPGLTADSVHYVATARNVMAGHGFESIGSRAYTSWPPAMPVTLGLLTLTGRDLVWSAGVLNAVAAGATVVVAGLWILGIVRRRWLAVAGALLVATSQPLLYVSKHLWSEPLFILFAALSLWCLGRYLTSASWRLLFVTAILVSLACLTRYLGVTLIGTGALLILLLLRAPLGSTLR